MIGPLTPSERLDILKKLQRKGAAVSACECGSFSWMPPEECYLSPTAGPDAQSNMPKRLVVALTCAQCGFVKLYDPMIAGALPRNGDELTSPIAPNSYAN